MLGFKFESLVFEVDSYRAKAAKNIFAEHSVQFHSQLFVQAIHVEDSNDGTFDRYSAQRNAQSADRSLADACCLLNVDAFQFGSAFGEPRFDKSNSSACVQQKHGLLAVDED